MFSTSRLRSATILLILAAGVAAWHAVARADKPESKETRLSPEVVEDILRLRRSLLGNSPGAPSPNLLATEEQFKAALSQLSSDAVAVNPPINPPPTLPYIPDTPNEAVPVPSPIPEPPNSPVWPVVPRQSSNATPPLYSPVPSDHDPLVELEEADPDEAIVAALRNTSRMLDNRAHDLDAEHRFDEAKQLRKLAARLRKDARKYGEGL